MQIEQIRKCQKKHIENFINNKISDEITFLQGKNIINELINLNLINKKEAIIILCAIEDKNLELSKSKKNSRIRANILKNIIKVLFDLEEG